MARLYGKLIMVLIVSLVLVVPGYGGEHDEHGFKLPKVVRLVLDAVFPTAEIEEVEKEEECIAVFEIAVSQDGREQEIEITEDGQILEVETVISADELPKAVAKTLKAKARGGEILEIEKEVIRAVIQVVKLRKPKVVYEAVIEQDGEEYELTIAANGKILAVEKDDDDGEDEGDEAGCEEEDCDGEGEDEDENISMDELPRAVRATVKKIAREAEVVEIEVEDEGEELVYEVEVIYKSKEYDIIIAEDGEVIAKEAEDEDEDGDEEEHEHDDDDHEEEEDEGEHEDGDDDE